MTRKEVIFILKKFNAWRQGEDIKQHDPREITAAINRAIKLLDLDGRKKHGDH